MDIQELQRNEVTLIDDVESLIDRVRTAHREAQAQAVKAKEYASKAIDRAFDAGDLLLLLKPSVKHGQWESFLADRLPEISVRQAQKYMRIARDLPLEKRTGALLTVNGALRMLEAPDDEPANEPAANDFVLPWKRSGDPVSVAATVRQWPDLRFAATAYMDTAGMSIKEIAKELNQFDEEIEPFVNTTIPPMNFSEVGLDVDVILNNTTRIISSIKAKAYMEALGWAEMAKETNLAAELNTLYRKEQRIYIRCCDKAQFNPALNPFFSLEFEYIIGKYLADCALGLAHFDNRGWLAYNRAIDFSVCAFDYSLLDTKYGIADIWQHGFKNEGREKIPFISAKEAGEYHARVSKIIESLSIPYDKLGTATIEELKAEKKLLWYNDSAIYHGDASKIRLAA